MTAHVSPNLSSNVRVTLAVEKFVHGGDGLGRLDTGEVVFIPRSVPGDLVEVVLEKGPGKTRRGTIVRLIEPSPDRIQAWHPDVEPHPERDWGHVSLAAQRRWKRQIVEETLRRLGKLQAVAVAEPLAPPEAAGGVSRNRIVLQVLEAAGSYTFGYFRPKSHEVIPFDAATTAAPVFGDLVRWLAGHLPPGTGLEGLQLRINETGEVLLTFRGEHLDTGKLAPIVTDLRQAFPQVVGADALSAHGHRVLAGQGYLQYRIGRSGPEGRSDEEKVFQVSSESFFQPNLDALSLILETLSGWLPAKLGTLLDLYAGVGVFGLSFSDRTEQVILIESSPSAVADAQANVALNHLTQATVHWGDVARVLADLTDLIDTAVLDPPRSGCSPEVLTWLGTHDVSQLIYISCDPATLARDLRRLTDQGWRIEAVQPVDMFPHTHHVETLVNLYR